MKHLFDIVSAKCSKITTLAYSTSFSLGIKFLAEKFHEPIYGIYGFVRFADEIVDSFHDYDKKYLLEKFRKDTFEAIGSGISLNPILNSYQRVVNRYGIDHQLTETFLTSMEMDLNRQLFSRQLYQQYILGSAEVVGLMCLKVFCEGDSGLYEALKQPAMKLGSAFQKVNFLRDVKADRELLGRTYFPGVDLENFSSSDKRQIELEIQADFHAALDGIRRLPLSSRKGVYLAYYYYTVLFKKIRNMTPQKIMSERIRIANAQKISIMLESMVRNQLNLL